MFKQNKILILLGIAAAAIAAWYIPFARALIVELGEIVQSHGLYVFAAAIFLTIVLAFIMVRSVKNARKRKRELDEVLRVAQQTNIAGVSAGAQRPQMLDDTAEEKAAQMQGTQTSEEALLRSNVTTGTFVKKRLSQVSADNAHTYSEDLFFQPVIDMGNGNIVAYEVYRQISLNSRKKPIFVQSSPSNIAAERARFELTTLEMIASTTNRALWSKNNKKNSNGILVHISEALMEDDELWAKCVALFNANKHLQDDAKLCVSSHAFADQPSQVIAERMEQLEALTAIGVELGLSGLEYDPALLPNKQLKCFDMVLCDRGTLLECYAGISDPKLLKVYTQVTKARLGLVVSGISCDADVVDCMAAGIKLMSGDYLAPPRKLKSEAAPQDDAAE